MNRFRQSWGGPTRAVEIGEETRVEEDCRDSNNEA